MTRDGKTILCTSGEIFAVLETIRAEGGYAMALDRLEPRVENNFCDYRITVGTPPTRVAEQQTVSDDDSQPEEKAHVTSGEPTA